MKESDNISIFILVERISKEAKVSFPIEEVMNNYVFKYFDEDIFVIEKESLDDYLYYKEAKEEKDNFRYL